MDERKFSRRQILQGAAAITSAALIEMVIPPSPAVAQTPDRVADEQELTDDRFADTTINKFRSVGTTVDNVQFTNETDMPVPHEQMGRRVISEAWQHIADAQKRLNNPSGAFYRHIKTIVFDYMPALGEHTFVQTRASEDPDVLDKLTVYVGTAETPAHRAALAANQAPRVMLNWDPWYKKDPVTTSIISNAVSRLIQR